MLRFTDSSILVNVAAAAEPILPHIFLVNKLIFLAFSTKVKVISIVTATTYIFIIPSIYLGFWYPRVETIQCRQFQPFRSELTNFRKSE